MVGIERVMDHVAHVLGLRPAGGAAARTTTRRCAGGGLSAPRLRAPPEDISGQKKPEAAETATDLASRGAVGDVPEGAPLAVPQGVQTTPYACRSRISSCTR